MREELLQYLICPVCQSSLKLTSNKNEGEEVLEGTIQCLKCQTSYPIERGVPTFTPHETVSEEEKNTTDGFGYEWNKWTSLSIYKKNVEQFFDWVWPITGDFFQGKVVLDAGCGMGRWPIIMAENGAKAIVAFDLGPSVYAAFENTRRYSNIHIVRANIFQMPFRQSFDFAHSLGVIHHTPDPGKAFDCLVQQLIPGGSIYVWVYGYENNEFIVKVITPIREKFTSRLPRNVLSGISFLSTVFLQTILKGIYTPVREGKADFLKSLLPYKDYLFWLSKHSFDHNNHVVFDHLVTPIAFYIKKNELEEWFERNKLENVQISSRNNNSWRGWGFKPVANKKKS